MSGVFQQRRGPGRFGRYRIAWDRGGNGEGVPNVFRVDQDRADNEFVMVSVISEIGFSPASGSTYKEKVRGEFDL